MIVALIILALALVICCFITSYFKFKTQELDYKKLDSEYAQKTIKDRTALEVEQERTKQRLLDKEAEVERRKQKEEETKREAERTKQDEEKTKQLEIKSQYQKETGKSLYC